MYKLLLCWRYLLTRYIAFLSIISVMLGVAIMIVVNAVMLGFTSEMKDRLHGILADVIFQTYDLNKGFPDYEWHRTKILDVAGDLIEELTPTAVTPGMLTYQCSWMEHPASYQVDVVGIDARTQGKVSKIAEFLQHPENRKQLSFDLRDGGYDTQSSGENGAHRRAMDWAGWEHRRYSAAAKKAQQKQKEESLPPSLPSTESGTSPSDPFANLPQAETPLVFDPAKDTHAGIIVGIGASLYQRTDEVDPETGKKTVQDDLMLIPGDDVMLSFPTADLPIRFQSDSFTVIDLYESKMTDYDRRLVFVPIEKVQQLRGMFDTNSGAKTITQILIKAKPGVDSAVLRDRLYEVFPPQMYSIRTWQEDQKELLEAVLTELGMLNVLLFMIFAVAGFGILAIFYMIVSEKKKDIGILKALGAGRGGIMQIFLCYSLLLGVVGSMLGLVVGLLFVKYIKEIAVALSYVLQRNVFSPEVYSLYEIPTIVDVETVTYIIIGAIAIAVAAGVFPALRAARIHPVETLRS